MSKNIVSVWSDKLELVRNIVWLFMCSRSWAVKPDATQDEVDRFIDSDDSPQVFAQSVKLYPQLVLNTTDRWIQLMHATRTNQARAVLSEVQTRHDDIKRIEKTIMVKKSKLLESKV